MEIATMVLELAGSLAKGIYGLVTAKSAQDRASAIAQMKADIDEKGPKIAALDAELAANDAAANAAVDAKFPPVAAKARRDDEPTVDLKPPVPVTDLK